MNDIPEWVHQEIQHVRDNNLTELDLSRQLGDVRPALQHIPDQICDLTHLKVLNLDEHEINDIPEGIQNLNNLTHLTLHGSYETIPEYIGNLTHLTHLELIGTGGRGPKVGFSEAWWTVGKYTYIPSCLSGLSELTYLRLAGQYNLVPNWIGDLPKITHLGLTGTYSEIPESLVNMKNLAELVLFGEFEKIPRGVDKLILLSSLHLSGYYEIVPDEIFRLKDLTSLGLYGRFETVPNLLSNLSKLIQLALEGKLETIPSSVFTLRSLSYLDLERNSITKIPSEILNLISLTNLVLDENPIQTPPAEIVFKTEDSVHGTNLQAIRDYYQSLQAESEDHLYEAKLLILGEGGAGKTSLARKILDPTNELTSDEKSTEGIDVMRWDFSVNDERSFRVNIWDFGGQEIYHATHQFFLTNRSLYALVADSRKEDTDFNYWLNVVELLGGDSPVLIIKNEKQNRQRQIGEPQLRQRFGNIAEILATNLKDNRNLARVVDEIKHRMRTLSHVGTPLPRSWVAVRNALEKDDRNYITIQEYRDICKHNGLDDLSKQSTVIEYLHDLGVCLHFKHDPILKRYVILKPHWGTSAVYCILDNKAVIQNHGRFIRDQLELIWHDASYDDMHDELLQLMMRFKLCYQIPGMEGTFIAPQLLSEDQPTYAWDDADTNYLRYTYEFMPKGMVTRLIVAMHRYIENDFVWKTGVILKLNDTWAEVIEHYRDNRIHIRVMGRDKKALLAVIMHELEDIHTTYHGLKYDCLIPCNCEKCKSLTQPYFFLYDVLQRSLAETDRVQCQSSFMMVDTRRLLDNALPERINGKHKNAILGNEAIKVSTDRDKSIYIERVDHLVLNNSDIENQQMQEILGGTGSMEQNSNKSDIHLHGNVQAGNLNIGGQQTFGDNVRIETKFSALQDAPAGSPLAELRQLLEELEAKLKNEPAGRADDIEAVQDYANAAAEEAAKEKPNPKKLKITGESLKAAAENLLSVAPIAAKIAAILLQIK